MSNTNLTKIIQEVDTMHSVFTDMVNLQDSKELVIAEVINWYERNRFNIKAYWDRDYHVLLNEEQRRKRGNLCKKMEECRKELAELIKVNDTAPKPPLVVDNKITEPEQFLFESVQFGTLPQ